MNPASTPPISPPGRESARGRRDLGLAWLAGGLLVPAVAGLLFVSERAGRVAGQPGAWPESAPAAAGVLVLLVAATAVLFGARAWREGEQLGRVPALVGGAVLGFFAATLLLGLVGHVLLGLG